MRRIVFTGLQSYGLKTSLDVLVDGQAYPLWLEFSEDPGLTKSDLALALSTLCGSSFDEISYDFPVAGKVVDDIARWTRSVVSVSEEEEPLLIATEDRVVLNFSGGFDSLAARALLPANTELVSLDFGGRFSRERKFFSTFSPRMISTNLVETPLRQNSWSFMGIGPILYRQKLKARYFSFGSIYEAAQFRRVKPTDSNYTFPPFAAAGYENAAVVQGLTEVGTLMIILSKHPELVESSLRSLAHPGEEKYFRKIALSQAVAEALEMDIQTPDLPHSQKVHYHFGQNFAVDITALFFISIGRRSLADQLVQGIPAGIAEEFSRIEMDFMFKANQEMYVNYPESLKQDLVEGLRESGVEWYSATDQERLEDVRKLLADTYSF